MPTEANTVLSDEQIAEIETAQVKRRESLAFHQSEYPGLPAPDYIAQIDALCATVKALRASDRHNYDLWLSLKERHEHKFKDGKWPDGAADRFCEQCGISTSEDHAGTDCIAHLQSRLSEVERERNELRQQLDGEQVMDLLTERTLKSGG